MMLKSNRTVYHSIFPPSIRWTGFFFILTNFRAYFAINISTKVWLEPVKVSLRCQLLIRILIVLPLCEHVIDQPDGQQVEVGYADTKLHTAQHEERGGHYPLTFARFFLSNGSLVLDLLLISVLLGERYVKVTTVSVISSQCHLA